MRKPNIVLKSCSVEIVLKDPLKDEHWHEGSVVRIRDSRGRVIMETENLIDPNTDQWPIDGLIMAELGRRIAAQ